MLDDKILDSVSLEKKETPKKKKRKPKFNREAPSPEKLAVDLHASPNTKKIFWEKLKKINSKIRPVTKNEDGITCTPNKTVITKLTSHPFGIYDERPAPPPDAKKNEKNSTTHFLKAFGVTQKDNKKTKTATLTKKLLEKIKKQKKLKSGRTPNQDTVMGEDYGEPRISANVAAERHGYDKTVGWNWGHLIAHRFLPNEEAQKSDNLVLMTSHCNTLMMFVEDEIEKLVALLPDNKSTVELTVTSDLNEQTNIATHIVYNIKSTALSFDLTLEFNPLSTYRPQQTLEDPIKALFQTALEIKKPLFCIDTTKQMTNVIPSDKTDLAKNKELDSAEEDDFIQILKKPKQLDFSGIKIEKTETKEQVDKKEFKPSLQ